MQNLKNMRLKFWEPKDVSWDGVFYRIMMRIAHKYHWHYAPVSDRGDGKIHLWCQWCGFRQTIRLPNTPTIDLIGHENAELVKREKGISTERNEAWEALANE